nr:hypothetical protein [Candidatus Sigynarchaeota archaeon]
MLIESTMMFGFVLVMETEPPVAHGTGRSRYWFFRRHHVYHGARAYKPIARPQPPSMPAMASRVHGDG